MKRALLAAAAVLAATVAQAETIYVAPNSVTPWHSKVPFKSVRNGTGHTGRASAPDELLVEVEPLTSQDLIIVAKDPESTVIASTNVLLLDDNGMLVENLQVVVTPFGGPSITLRRGSTTYVCGMSCIPADKSNKNVLGDANSITTVTNSDGSSAISKTWVMPPK